MGVSIKRVLVANRGEIACRVMHTLRELGIESVAIFVDADAHAPHVALADHAVALADMGDGGPRGYLNVDALLLAAHTSKAQAIHPGYGFVSQSADFVDACNKAQIVFIGPSAAAMRALGDKRSARKVAFAANVPTIPGAEAVENAQDALQAANKLGYPVLVKAAGGGGGKGMRQVATADEVESAFLAARREAVAGFGDDRMLVERWIYPARHVEVQILGDGKKVIALGERECSLQRRYQKIIEETPSPGIDHKIREQLLAAAISIGEEVGYLGAGTVEFLVGPDGSFYFLEVNTRLQVEHPITEWVFGIDIVAAQMAVVMGEGLPKVAPPCGFAMEARINAEQAYAGFLPATGKIEALQWPQRPWLRVDTGIAQGSEIGADFDPMLAKITVWGPSRAICQQRLTVALQQLVLLGVSTNQTFLLDLLSRSFFAEGETYTTTVEAEDWQAPALPAEIQAALPTLRHKIQNSAMPGMAAIDGKASAPSPWQLLGHFGRMGWSTKESAQ